MVSAPRYLEWNKPNNANVSKQMPLSLHCAVLRDNDTIIKYKPHFFHYYTATFVDEPGFDSLDPLKEKYGLTK